MPLTFWGQMSASTIFLLWRLWRWIKEAVQHTGSPKQCLMAGKTEEVNTFIISEFAPVTEQQKPPCSAG